MKILYIIGVLLTGISEGAAAQASPAEQVPHLPAFVAKGGLRLTQFSVSRHSSNWQAVVPAAVGLEYRLNSRYSLYTQLDANVQLANDARSRRKMAVRTALPTTALGLGGRCYYGRPSGALRTTNEAPDFGRYVALEAGCELTQSQRSTTRGLAVSRRPGWNNAALLAPYVFARWGVQNRWRSHMLYDLNAGLGLVAPVRPAAEYTGANHRLDIAAQVNVSLYVAN
jgi:hypothetical protein